jgi:dienelactone hydrolase
MRAITAFGVVARVLAGCGDGGGGSGQTAATTATPTSGSPTTTVPERTAVEHLTLDLVDRTRATPAGAGLPGSDRRELVTEVHLPVGTAPFPFIAFSHGLDGHPRKFTELFQAWAEAGYLVAAPAFPLSNDEVPGESTFTDLAEQPGDISFVIDQVLEASEGSSGPLAGQVDADRIGVAGLSLGGATTYGVAFNDCCRDERPRAALVMDAARLALPGEFDLATGLPLLVMHADDDQTLPYADSESAYDEASAPKWFITLHEAVHAEPYENTPDPADELVRAATIAFWDLYLRDDPDAEQRLIDAVTPADLASLVYDPG